MKWYLLILAVSSMGFTNLSKDPTDRIGVKGPLIFNKVTFSLSWTDKPNATYYIQEYLPKGEKVDQFNQLLTIHLFDKDIKIEDAVQQKVKELTVRKTTDPACNYQVSKSPNGKEYIVDFILSESQGDKMSIVEFNIYRYKQVDLGTGKKGILVYAYSKRAYGDDITAFLKNLKTYRPPLLNAMSVSEMPKVKIADK